MVAAAWELKGIFCASVPLIFSLNSEVKVRKLVYVIAKEITNFFSSDLHIFRLSTRRNNFLGGEGCTVTGQLVRDKYSN